MLRKPKNTVAVLICSLVLWAGCEQEGHDHSNDHEHGHDHSQHEDHSNDHGPDHGYDDAGAPDWSGVTEAVAVIHPTEGNEARGVVHFVDNGDGTTTISALVEGLTPNQWHGFHVHEFGDCTAADATSAGGHYNPGDHPHGLPGEEDVHRHAGDLGNLEANEDGVAEYELVVDNLSVAGKRNPVLGRGVIVHEGEDDGSQPLGGAGARIGCGVIGVANPRT